MTIRANPPICYIDVLGRQRTVEFPSDWIDLGVAPLPRGVWGSFRYHLLHGLLMGYPATSVLIFAWRKRRGNWWQDPTVYSDGSKGNDG